MLSINNLPTELLQIILAKLDCIYDLSNCALVCHDWLDIINTHRSIQTTFEYDHTCWPNHTFQRRFNRICVRASHTIQSLPVDRSLFQHAKVVQFDHCIFSSLATLTKCILACGNLSRLEITLPSVEDCEKALMAPGTTAAVAQKIETLVLYLYDEQQCDILEIFHSEAIEVVNLELYIACPTEPDALRPLFDLLEQHYLDKLRRLDANEECVAEFITANNSSLKLDKLCVYSDVDLETATKLIMGQPTITDLTIHDFKTDIGKLCLNHLPALTVLQLDCYELDELANVICQNTHCLCNLTSLAITLPRNNLYSDIDFIAKLPKLRKFSCAFGLEAVVKLGFIAKQMLEMKEFHLLTFPTAVYGVDIDAVAMATIFHSMPNLEQLSLKVDNMTSEATGGYLQFLKKLYITATVIDNLESVQKLRLPNLRYLKLDHRKTDGSETAEAKYVSLIGSNFPLLARIETNLKLYKRNCSGDFELCKWMEPLKSCL